MPASVVPPVLIRTKLHRPRVPVGVVPLARVRRALDHDLDRPLTLVCAPAGFGKTTLLSAWLTTCPRLSAWLALDERDGDPVTFLAYLVAAVGTLFPEACAETRALLLAMEPPPLAVLSAALNNDIDSLADTAGLPAGQRFILVLDDYHRIRNKDVHQLLDTLLLHPPRPLHLVLSARRDPPLSLNSLRARGQLVEIRTDGLRFAPAETAAFIRQAVRFPVDPETIVRLEKHTEGWAAGLRFAALALNSRGGADQPALDLPLDIHAVTEYLLSEVLAHLPAAAQTFLIQTAVLDRLSGPLCDALTGPADPAWSSQRQLEWLERENAFTYGLDDQGQWYRYHRLFQALLRNQLERSCTAGEIADLHRRASAWYAANGFVEDAVQHALAAGDEIAAAQLVETHGRAAFNQEQWQRLECWLGLLPRRLIDQRPGLLILETWLLQQRWRFNELPSHLDRVEALMDRTPLPEPDQIYLRSEVDLLRGRLCYYAADANGALALAERALQHAPMAYSVVRGVAWMTYASALQLQGDLRGTRDALQEGLKEGRYHDAGFLVALLLADCHLNWMAAELTALRQRATHYLKLASEMKRPDSLVWAHYLLGCAAYQLNDLAGAEQAFAAAVGHRYAGGSFQFSQSAFGLASVYLAQGAGERVQALIDAVLAHGREIGSDFVLDEARAFQAYLALQLGPKAEAERWAASCDLNRPLTPQAPFHEQSFTLVKILLDQATPRSLAKAADALGRLREFASKTHNTLYLIHLYALQALLHEARGERAAALAALKQAVLLAEPGGVLRVFLDLGEPMAALLAELAGQDDAPDFAGVILRSFPPLSDRPVSPSERPGVEPARPGRFTAQSGLIEPLTRRELEVLPLLAQHLTAREIGAQLVISEKTAKRHIANIYQKLGVNRRRDALAAAQAAGLLAAR